MTISTTRKASNQEEVLLLIIEVYKKNQFKSIWATAQFYNLSFIILCDYLHDATTHMIFQRKNRKLTTTAEESLVQWIISLNMREQSSWVVNI